MYWKTGKSYAVREGPWKLLVHRNNNIIELYNLENDFRETHNLSTSNPEKTEDLLEMLEEFKEGDRE
jgi:arylsulfatase A-like enzyme